MNKRAMLAATLDKLEDVKFPVLVQPKLDGIRCLIVNGEAVSKEFKAIPNKSIQSLLAGLPDGLDGELVIAGIDMDFSDTQSAIMSEEGEPDFFYVVFDYITEGNYEERYNKIVDLIETIKDDKPYIRLISTNEITDLSNLQLIENQYVAHGYEGIMIRASDKPYKQGTSTNGELLKYKRFKDTEGVVIGFKEQLFKGTKIGKNTLGALILDNATVGTGYSKKLRKEIWDNKEKYLGLPVTYKYQTLYHSGKPRFPVFKGFRLENK